MTKTQFIHILISFLLTLSPCFAIAQNATIRGLVTDQTNNEELVGASIFLQGTTTGASTNLDGRYEIKNIPPGTYTLVARYISYKEQQFHDVRLQAGQVLEIDIELESDAFLMEGVTVVARRTTGTDIAMLSAIRSSEMVVSGISSQQIRRSQDSDAAQVVKRVPGVTLVGNRFINIRGLSERYNAVLLHDVYAPSMEADVRSFSFDIIPSGLIDQVMIYKSPSPELPGDFAGGVVKIYTKGIPDENNISVSYSASVIDGVSFTDFYRAPQEKGYWSGFNNGKYDLPEDFPQDLRQVITDQDAIDAAGRSLQNAWVADEIPLLWNHSASVNLSRRFELRNNRYLGSITSISYSNSKQKYNVERKDFNSYDFVEERSSLIYNFNDFRNVENIRLGIIQNFAYSINPNNIIEFKNLFNQISQSEYIHRTGPNYDFNFNANNHSFYQIYRGIYAGQLTGNHTISEHSKLDWVAGVGFSFRDEPDYRRFRSDLDTVTGQSTLYVPFGAAAAYFLGRYYSEMRENNYTLSTNYSYMFDNLYGFKPMLNIGLFAEYKDRFFESRNIGYVRASLLGFDSGLLDVSIDSLFHPENINGSKGIMIDEQSNPSDSYAATNLNMAGYVSVFFPLTSRLNISGGLRLEHNTQTLSSFTLTNDPIEVNNPLLSLLPSVNISYALSDDMLIRAAYGKTLNRPEFRELAPFGFYDFNFNLVRKGSDTIRIATAHNFDLRWEYYPSGNEVINVGVFYKRFIDPIETSFVPGGGSGGIKTFTYANAAGAVSLGMEAEVRKSLRGLFNSGFVDKFSVLFNAALIRSEVELGDAGLGQSVDSRAMFGQSPYIVNAGLYFHDSKSMWHINVLYNVIGRRIYVVGYDDYPDIYEMPRNLLDLTVTKNFGRRLELKFGVSNILSEPVLLLQDANADGIFDRENDQRIQYFVDPRSFSLGLSYQFN